MEESDIKLHGRIESSTRSQREQLLPTMKGEKENVNAEAVAHASAHAHAMQA
jgi:hypothetical protein